MTDNAGVSSHTTQAKVLTGDVGDPDTAADSQALGPEGGLETQDNSSFIKRVADKLHLRNKHEDKHPQHRKMEVRLREALRPLRSCLRRLCMMLSNNPLYLLTL